MAGGGGVQHVGFEHGVEGHALHLDRRDGIGQDIDVVLGVLTDLGLGRVLQNRLERAQHRIAVELSRHAHVGMRQRDIGRFAGLDGEGHADQLGLLGVEAGGSVSKAMQLGAAQLLQPGVELRLLQDALVIAGGLRGLSLRFRLRPLRLLRQRRPPLGAEQTSIGSRATESWASDLFAAAGRPASS